MKTLHLSLIMFTVIIFLGFGLQSAHADDANGISIQNIKIQPSKVKVGDAFTIAITLVNNSTVPIWLDGGKCSSEDIQASFFTVIFDNHAKIKEKDINCAGVGWSQKLDPGKNITSTSPDYTASYIATDPGNANAKMTYSYHVINQTDPTQPGFSQTTSKSFLFTILDNNTGTKMLTETILSPLQQFKSGISLEDITCNDGFFFAISNEKNPLCLKSDTISKLASRGFLYGINSNETKTNYTTIIIPPGSENQASNKTYSPNLVKIIIGVNNTVRWINQSPDLGNTVVEDINDQNYSKTFNSSFLKPGQSYEFTFTQPGTYHFHGEPHPWQVGTVIVMQSTNGTTLPVSFMVCDTPYNPKETYLGSVLPNGTRTITGYTPIFYMPMNSTGKICVHYSNSNPPGNVGIRVFDANDLSNDAKDITTSASQNTIPTGNTTVVYTIKTGNKAGFYGISLFCGGQAFAVGYDNQSRIVVDDFPWYGKTFHCPAQTYDFKITGLGGIGIYYITETTRPQIGYNVTGISVSSVHLTPSSQNVTFTLNVRTYNTGAKLWFDFKDSNAIKFIGDPLLKEYSNPCNWSFNNDRSVDNAQWLKLVGGFRVTDNPVTIPPYSNGTYTFSILAKNLDYGWYGLSPIIFSESPNSDIPLENLGGSAVASYYPITMGLDSNLDPSGVCDR